MASKVSDGRDPQNAPSASMLRTGFSIGTTRKTRRDASRRRLISFFRRYHCRACMTMYRIAETKVRMFPTASNAVFKQDVALEWKPLTSAGKLLSLGTVQCRRWCAEVRSCAAALGFRDARSVLQS